MFPSFNSLSASKIEFTDEEVHFRGMFMSFFIDLEFLIGDTLAKSLVGENELKLTLTEFINPNFILNTKLKVLINVLKSRYKPLYKEYKKTLDTLQDFIPLRNDFAHKRIYIDIKKKKLSFIVIINKREVENSYTYNDLEKKFIELKKAGSELTQLNEKLDTI